MRKASIIMLALCVAVLTSCKSTKHFVQEAEAMHDTLYKDVVKIDTLYKTMFKMDSIMFHDSIYIKEYLKGDTLVQYKYVEQTKYRDRIKHDTLYRNSLVRDTTYISKTDTVTKVDVKEVVKTPLRTGLKWLLFGLVAGAAGMWIIKKKYLG